MHIAIIFLIWIKSKTKRHCILYSIPLLDKYIQYICVLLSLKFNKYLSWIKVLIIIIVYFFGRSFHVIGSYGSYWTLSAWSYPGPKASRTQSGDYYNNYYSLYRNHTAAIPKNRLNRDRTYLAVHVIISSMHFTRKRCTQRRSLIRPSLPRSHSRCVQV